MKHLTKLFLLAIFVIFASCQNENVSESEDTTLQENEALFEDEIIISDGEEDETLVLNAESETPAISKVNKGLTFSSSSNSYNDDPKIIKECKVLDANNCNTTGQPSSNFWWPLTETDYYSGFFESTDDHKLNFTEYDNGTAHLSGTTSAVTGGCIVTIDVWFKDKKDWTAWSAEGGLFKDEDGCSGDEAESLHYYKIDTQRSTITSEGGECIDEGVYGLEQRPEGKYGVQVGPGGAIWDTNVGANGLGTWAWIVDKTTKERLWVMDFNFLLECEEEECKPCTGKVEDLTLKFDWCRSKRVKIYQKRENSCYGTKIFDKVLQHGEEFTINGANSNGTFGKYIYIYINHCYYTKIKTNCYLKIGPGYTKGIFDVISGHSTEGGELCEYVKPDYKCYRHWSCKDYSKCRYNSGH